MRNKEIKSSEIALAVDVVIFNSVGQVLLGKRLAKAGYGTWGFPGGHVEEKEDIFTAAKREIKEELGDNFKSNVLNDVIAVRDNCLPPQFLRHITVILKGEYIEGDLAVNEPDKCEKWEWFDLDKLPTPLFSGIDEALSKYVQKKSSII